MIIFSDLFLVATGDIKDYRSSDPTFNGESTILT